MLLLSVAVLAVASVTHLTEAYPFEVAKAACEDMTPKGPGHQNVSAQNSKVNIDNSYSIKPPLLSIHCTIYVIDLSLTRCIKSVAIAIAETEK